jgi:hypothetical protein
MKRSVASSRSSFNISTVDHNPFLEHPARSSSNEPAKGEIESRHPENLVWQTRAAPPTGYESSLGDALEEIFEEGHETLESVVARLNALGVRAPDGTPWEEESFQAVMKQLGA